jgi:hypothetical protein
MDIANNFNLDTFNSFLQQAQNALLCDSQCQKKKQAQILENTYLNAEANLKTAPSQVEASQQNYITYTQGPGAYSQIQDQKYNEKAQKIVTMFKDNFYNDSKQLKDKVTTYNGLLDNYNNVYDLYLKYKEENSELKKELNNKNTDVTTNDRKTYYENQEIDFLDYIYYYVLRIIYGIVVLVYFISVFAYPSPFNWKIKIAILILLVILPFISTWLLSYFIEFIYYIYSFLPKNVYAQL